MKVKMKVTQVNGVIDQAVLDEKKEVLARRLMRDVKDVTFTLLAPEDSFGRIFTLVAEG